MLTTIVRFCLAVFFIFSAVLKILSPESFLQAIVEFDLLATVFLIPAAAIIISIEFICGVLLLVNRISDSAGETKFRHTLSKQTRYAGIALITLLALFTIVIFIALLQNKSISCGCFGELFSSQISAWSIIRNCTFIILLYICAVKPSQQNVVKL